MGKFELLRSSDGDTFCFQLKAGNGQVVLTSQRYTSRRGCISGIGTVRKNANSERRYQRKDGGQFSFNLKAANGEIIGRSKSYTSALARENGIRSVKHNASVSRVEDLTWRRRKKKS